MPELTVSMPAYNRGNFIGKAIESVLRQDGIDFELIVVDDGSTDNTAEVVQSFKDPRVRLIRNEKNMGIAYCHNLIIEQSTSPFIAHVDSDDVVRYDAFRKMVEKLKTSPHIGQVHCNYFLIDENGRMIKDHFLLRLDVHGRISRYPTKKGDRNYRREILVHGAIMNGLRTYRREVFDVVGRFNEKLKFSEDTEMAIRMLDKYEIKHAPEFLYCVRIHKNNTSQHLWVKELRFWLKRVFFCLDFLKSDRVQYLRIYKEYIVNGLMIEGLYYALSSLVNRKLSPIRNIVKKFCDNIYKSMFNHLSRWPIDLFNSNKGKEFLRGKRIAYYLWNFPALTETFIQREVLELRRLGLSIDVVADSLNEVEFLDEDARSLIDNTYYLEPVDKELFFKYNLYFFIRKPLVYLNLFFYVVTHRYTKYKRLKRDIEIFGKAVYLAGVLKDKHIDHAHAPWADMVAFVSLIASRLLGISYSVEGRAADIHRKKNRYALVEKFKNATFIITNTQYNESYIKSILDKQSDVKIQTIYEGINLELFKPKQKKNNRGGPTRILTVSRLVEEKGLPYLLKACKILKDRGYVFRSDIIGGPHGNYMENSIMLYKLHSQLGLEDCVFFLGNQPFKKVLEEFNNTDIFILPCVIAQNGGRDISPNALIEAMAMKLPVISTKIAAIPEIVEDGVSGILVSPNDENSLAEAVIKLIEDPGLRKSLGEHARKKIEERFDIKKNYIKFTDLFKGKVN